MFGNRLQWAASIALAVAAAAPSPAAPARDAGLRLVSAFVVMRHGVRPPTKDPALPAGSAAEPWPAWPAAPGELTPHGAQGIRLLAAWDRSRWVAAGLLPARGCPAPGLVRLASDSDQRTIATGDVYAQGLVPGCGVANDHLAQGRPDPLFAAAGAGPEPYDPARADAAVAAALGPRGIGGVEADHRAELAMVDRILCGERVAGCGIEREASAVIPAAPGRRPKLGGALDRGSTAAQVLLLEYAEGKPMAQVGWGRATPADITRLSVLHATEFAIAVRPPYLARRYAAPIASRLRSSLASAAPGIVAIAGHDTQIAALAGMLDLHWHVPGYAADDPAPGGALMFERLRATDGREYVRVTYRAQTLDQLRTLAELRAPTAPSEEVLAVKGCRKLCPLARFETILGEAIPRS